MSSSKSNSQRTKFSPTPEMESFIDYIIQEDIGKGDHTSLACIPTNETGKARLLVKEPGILAGVELAEFLFHRIDPYLKMTILMKDGSVIKPGDIAFTIEGSAISILTSERLVLNFMQRMSGIATKTREFSRIIEDLPVKILDTRKTTPGLRYFEKWAVRIGGGQNHRFGLFDMIMIKDNHADYCGGVQNAIKSVKKYLHKNQLDLKIEVEARNREQVEKILEIGGIDIIMLDNFTPHEIIETLPIIGKQYQTEASGNIGLHNLRAYAETGVNFISSGALTHSVKSLDLSLKAY